MQTIANRDGISLREGPPRAVRLSLCSAHNYLTFSGECTCRYKSILFKFAVIGTPYGWLHSTSGDPRQWGSASGARTAAKRYVCI